MKKLIFLKKDYQENLSSQKYSPRKWNEENKINFLAKYFDHSCACIKLFMLETGLLFIKY